MDAIFYPNSEIFKTGSIEYWIAERHEMKYACNDFQMLHKYVAHRFSRKKFLFTTPHSWPIFIYAFWILNKWFMFHVALFTVHCALCTAVRSHALVCAYFRQPFQFCTFNTIIQHILQYILMHECMAERVSIQLYCDTSFLSIKNS